MAWRQQQGRDRFFRQAKQEGFRARSAYKLKEAAERYSFLKPGMRVVDLGAAPGSWSQLAVQLVGPNGKVVAVDLQPIAELPGVHSLVGDIRELATIERVRDALGGPADVVLSDVAPKTTGVAVTDQARSIELAEAALEVAEQVLRPRGAFFVKVFQGPDFKGYLEVVRRKFLTARVVVPEATRKESQEVFVLGVGFAGGT